MSVINTAFIVPNVVNTIVVNEDAQLTVSGQGNEVILEMASASDDVAKLKAKVTAVIKGSAKPNSGAQLVGSTDGFDVYWLSPAREIVDAPTPAPAAIKNVEPEVDVHEEIVELMEEQEEPETEYFEEDVEDDEEGLPA